MGKHYSTSKISRMFEVLHERKFKHG